MQGKLLTRLTVLTSFLLGSFHALGSHYPIEAVPFVEEGHKSLLAAQKLTETRDLLNALLTPTARQTLSKKTGIPVEKLEEYVHLCDLLRIRGLGPKMAKILLLAGVDGVEKLRSERAEAVLRKMKTANDKHAISEILPEEETLNDWIQQARNLEIIVK